MGRLAPPGFQRFRQALPGSLDVTFAGAEANVAASLAIFGASPEFVTALPSHDIADACVGAIRNLGVGTDHIVRNEGRLGLYFLETGANQRPSRVIYDRAESSISLTPASAYRWHETLQDARWFHVTGITPAISKIAFEATLEAVQVAQKLGIKVSCDLNFRKKLWQWQPNVAPGKLAGETMRKILPFVDVVIANEEDCHDVLGIQAVDSDVESGKLNVAKYPDVARKVAEQFPNLSRIAITLRESISASHNNWGGMLFDVAADKAFFAPVDGEYCPYEIRNIVDRVGGGDSFAAGLIFAAITEELADSDSTIRFAVAASCLAHSIVGDFNYSTRDEVMTLMKGSGSGRVVR